MRGIKILLILIILSSISSTVFSESRLVEQCVEAWLSENFSVQNGRWSVTLLSSNKPLKMSKVTFCKVVALVGLKKPKKIMVFKVVPKMGNTLVYRKITVRVFKYVKVPITNKVIRNRVTIDGKDWRFEERDADLLSKDVIKNSEELRNKRSKKILSINEVLTRHAIEKIPDITQGKEITLRVVGYGIILSTDAVSMEEGNISEWIKLKQQYNGQVVKARIIGPSEAQIHLARR
ncbi:flagellar basal body P-ring formation chaperone FlgA [bacterium]|nr:flagellar basal body P-ring formation chaperone FlgA [bacterium]